MTDPNGLKNITVAVRTLLHQMLPHTDVRPAPDVFFRFDFERCVVPDIVGLSGVEDSVRAGVSVATTPDILTNDYFKRRAHPKVLLLHCAYAVEDRARFTRWRGTNFNTLLTHRADEIENGSVLVRWFLVERHPLESLALEAP